MTRTRNEFYFLEFVELNTASSSEHDTSSRYGAICFYVLLFKFGLRLPFLRFIRAFLSYFGLSSGKLMPNCWRTIMAILVLENLHDFQLDNCILLKWYNVKENTHERDRYMLNAGCHNKIFDIFYNSSKDKYFIVSID